MNWSPILLSLRLAAIATLILFLLAIPISYWLAYSCSRLKPFIETVITLPLVLPPTVIGFYLLIAWSPAYGLGEWLQEIFGVQLLFSFSGLIIASVLYNLPFMVHPIQSGLTHLPHSLKEASYTLGKSELETLLKVLLPNIKPALLTGIVLTFAHTIGEFGLVLMIGGNIPNHTRVAAIAIYDEVEALNYIAAHQYSLILMGMTFFILLMVYYQPNQRRGSISSRGNREKRFERFLARLIRSRNHGSV